MKTALVWLWVALAVGLGACQCGGPLPEEDAGVDASVPDDAGTDGGVDAGADAGVDAGEAPDAGDAGLDAGEDAGADAGDDAGWDAGEDDGGQSLLDAGVETCSSCHGSAANAAPPRDTQGRTDPGLLTVGAHQAHLAAPANWHRDVRCDDCHVVPQATQAAGHLDAPPAEVTFSALSPQGPVGTWANGSCTTYCHGATLHGGQRTTISWLDTGLTCEACHGFPPPAPHPQVASCGLCHPQVFLEPQRHVDGVLDVNAACGACHGVPPATGAHLAHYGETVTLPQAPRATYGDLRILEDYSPDGGPTYLFGCGQCHPLAESRHLDGVVDVELYDPAAPASSLKARNPPSAAYSGAPQRTCSDVACHSSGQDAPSYVTTPGWTSGARPGCDGCHGNPPRYAGTDAGANNHLRLAYDGWEVGHFGGLMEYHGSRGAGAITCQACHFDTVDPANTGPSGFYYLDTSGAYALDGGASQYTCERSNCHAPGSAAAPTGTGRVLPLRHVNGRRDIAFDRRTTLPAGYTGGVSQPPSAPFWVWRSWAGQVENKDLSQASWDATRKTCTNVSCHQGQLIVSASPRVSLRWGDNFDPNPCAICH